MAVFPKLIKRLPRWFGNVASTNFLSMRRAKGDEAILVGIDGARRPLSNSRFTKSAAFTHDSFNCLAKRLARKDPVEIEVFLPGFFNDVIG